MTVVEESLQDCLLSIGDEGIRTEKTDTIRLPYDNSPIAVVAPVDPALVARAAHAAREGAPVFENWSNFERAELLDRIAALFTFRADRLPDGGTKNPGIRRESPRYTVKK